MRLLRLLKDALWNLFDDDGITQSAALAFFTILSMSPLLVILVSVTGFVGHGLQQRLIQELGELLGPAARSGIQLVIKNVSEHRTAGTLSTIGSVLALLLSSTAVFVQLQKAMNRIWNLPGRSGEEVKEWFRKRLISLGMVIAVGFLLLVSLVVTAAVNFIFSSEGSIWPIVNDAASLVVFALAFGLIFKVLPDTHVTWRDVWVGALITSILFAAGKWAIGKYIGYSSVGSAYGAAGTLMVLLVWVYYTSLVFFYGAELTQVSSPYLRKHLGEKKEEEEGLISDDS